MEFGGAGRRTFIRPIDAIAANQPASTVANPAAVADATASGQFFPNPNSTGELLPAIAGGGISLQMLVFLALVLIVAWWSWQHGYITAAVHAVEREIKAVV